MPPVLQSVMRETLCSVGMMPESDFHWRDLLYAVCGCSLNGNAYVRFGTVPALDFHWRNLLYQSIWSTVRTSIVIGRSGTAAGTLFPEPRSSCLFLSFLCDYSIAETLSFVNRVLINSAFYHSINILSCISCTTEM